jgi:Flp pilus assembly pilin Flp
LITTHKLVCPGLKSACTGQSLIEYMLILVLIGLVCVVSLGTTGMEINSLLVRFTQQGLNSAPGRPPGS